MSNGEIVEELTQKDDDSWDSVADVPFKTWADEVEDKKVKRKEALDSYRAASEAFRMDFNERATGPEQFAEWIASEEDGISEEEIEFEGKKIKVYHLTGHEFLFLVHCINYRTKADAKRWPGVYEKSKAILDNPGNWMSIPIDNNPKNINTFGIKTGDANNVSASLVSDKIPNGHQGDEEAQIYYGFSDLGHRGVITASYRDMHTQQGWTSRVDGKNDFHEVIPAKNANPATIPGWTDDARGEKIGDWRTIQTIDTIEKHDGGGEVAFDRYEEDNGRSISPSFIYCPNFSTYSADELTDDQKRHAAYFNIPIVILHRDAYDKYQG